MSQVQGPKSVLITLNYGYPIALRYSTTDATLTLDIGHWTLDTVTYAGLIFSRLDVRRARQTRRAAAVD